MVLLDVIAGIYLPNKWAWMFLLFVLIAESILLSFYLKKRLFNFKIYSTITFSNSVTTLVGFFLVDKRHQGGHLLNWIPIYIYHGVLWGQTLLFLFVSFIITIIIEEILNFLMLKKKYKAKVILKGTILINVATYIVGAIIILIYSFTNY